jgi:hypothetical protein
MEVNPTFAANLRSASLSLTVRSILLIVIGTEFITSIAQGWVYGSVIGGFFVLSVAISIAAIVGGAWYASSSRSSAPDVMDVNPEAAANEPPRCPPNYHWDESIGGCVPDN